MTTANEPVCPCCGSAVSPLDLLMDDKTLSITYGGATAKLTAYQFRFVQTLIRAYPAVVSKEAVMAALYPNPDAAPEIKIVDVMACKIRKSLDALGLVISTSWGIGYAIELSEEDKAAVLRSRRFTESRRARRSFDKSDITLIRVYRAEGYPVTDIARRMHMTLRAVGEAIDAIEASRQLPALRTERAA